MASFRLMGKFVIAAMLAGTLAGCVDATIDVALTSQTTAKATTTQVMNADFYALVKMDAERKDDDPTKSEEFCTQGKLIETPDGGATCMLVEEGRFAGLTLGSSERLLTFSRVAPDKVRISLPLAELKDGLGPSGDDNQNQAVLQAFFSGHALTVHFSGGSVTDTNMVLSKDGKSAEQVVQFLDLLNGTGDLPDELYAIVTAPAP